MSQFTKPFRNLRLFLSYNDHYTTRTGHKIIRSGCCFAAKRRRFSFLSQYFLLVTQKDFITFGEFKTRLDICPSLTGWFPRGSDNTHYLITKSLALPLFLAATLLSLIEKLGVLCQSWLIYFKRRNSDTIYTGLDAPKDKLRLNERVENDVSPVHHSPEEPSQRNGGEWLKSCPPPQRKMTAWCIYYTIHRELYFHTFKDRERETRFLIIAW